MFQFLNQGRIGWARLMGLVVAIAWAGMSNLTWGQAMPVVFTTQQDHQHMLAQLGITKLRPGRNANADAPHGANYDEALANPYPQLPDLLQTTTGNKVATAQQWRELRRPELIRLVEAELYGKIPDDVPDVTWEIVTTREVEVGGRRARQHEVVGKVDDSACPEIQVKLSLSLTLPENVEGPVPVLMSFGWTPFELERMNLRGVANRGNRPRPPNKRDELLAAGWGCATLNPASIQEDSGGWQPRRFGPNAKQNAEPSGAGLTRGIIGLTNRGQPRRPDQWGALRAWAWGASRALDFLVTLPDVDEKRVGIAGVSRYGKAALVTMAFDQRFAMALIASSGAGGTALYRRDFGESPENLASSGAYHWMAGNFLKYAAEESSFGRKTAQDLSVDSHALLALCAPRLTFISHGVPERGDAHWLDHQGSFMAAIAAQPVFRLLGAGDLGRSDDYLHEKMPNVNVDLLDGALAWRQHDGGHTDGPNVKHFIRWANHHWGRPLPTTAFSSRTSPQPAPGPVAQTRRSLKEAVGTRFKMGVGVGNRVLNDPQDVALIQEHFQILTPENCMKPQGIHPAEQRWEFAATDNFASFARQHKLEMVGHCLVWAKDDRTDEWMKLEHDQPVSRETLLKRIESHVSTVVRRYADVVTQWDVVNEAVADGGDELLRDSVYSRTTGMEFIVTAFKAARANDPDALLIYNDYNGHQPAKRKKLIEFLGKLKELGAPVDAYGMQGHFELGKTSLAELRATFEELKKLGLKVVVSELDIDVVERGRWWAEDGKYRDELRSYNPFEDGLPADEATQLAEQYAGLFRLFVEYQELIERVSFWNLHDGQSWLNYFPWRRTNHPLLFDRQRNPKPAFDAVYQVLTEPHAVGTPRRPVHQASERTDALSKRAHQDLLRKTTQGTVDIYFQGDSITRRWGATDYPQLLALWNRQFQGWNAANFAWGGDTTHHILWRMRNGELDGLSPKIVVLQAGANNLPWRGPANADHVDDVVAGIEAIMAEFRQRFPNVRIVLTAMFPRDQNPQLAETIETINTRLKILADRSESVRWVDINRELTDSAGKLKPEVSSDGIHLEAAGYEIWGRALRPIFQEILGPPAEVDNAPPPTGVPRQ